MSRVSVITRSPKLLAYFDHSIGQASSPLQTTHTAVYRGQNHSQNRRRGALRRRVWRWTGVYSAHWATRTSRATAGGDFQRGAEHARSAVVPRVLEAFAGSWARR